MASVTGPRATKDGDRWDVRFYPEAGQPQQSDTFDSEAAAIDYARDVEYAIKHGHDLPARTPRRRRPSPTLEDVFETIWNLHFKNLKRKTRTAYSNKFAAHVMDPEWGIGHKTVKALQEDLEIIRDFHSNLLNYKKAGPTNVVATMAVLSAMFNQAARFPKKTGVHCNPVKLAGIRITQSKTIEERLSFAIEAVELVRACVWLVPGLTWSQRLEADAFLGLLLGGGVRPGEGRAADRSFVEGPVMMVRRSVEGDEEDDENDADAENDGRLRPELVKVVMPDGSVVDIGLTKTLSARPGKLFPTIREQLAIYTRLGPVTTEGWLFPGLLLENDWRRFKSTVLNPARVMAAEVCSAGDHAGLDRATAYELGRHSHAAARLAAGEPSINIADDLGHLVATFERYYARGVAVYRARFEAGLGPLDFDLEQREARARAQHMVEQHFGQSIERPF